jgi:uncharacterized membrane protein YjjP (DUF1212 family)
MKNILREAWFLVIPGTLLILAAIRDLISQSVHLRMPDAPLAAAAGLALLAGAYAFAKPRLRGTVLVVVGVAVALIFPNFIASDATYYVWLVICLIFAAGAMYLSLTHRRI